MELSRSMATVALLLLAGSASVDAARMVLSARRHQQSHPIEKVITLLDELSTKVAQDIQDEEIAFAKFSTWAKTSERTLAKGIAEKTEAKASLEEDISGKQATIESLTNEIEALDKKLSALNQRAQNSTDIRATDQAEYEEHKADLEATITAIEEAQEAIQRDGTAVVTLQVAKHLPVEFVQRGNLVGKPDPTIYKGKSGNVNEILKKLAQDFKDKLQELINSETDSLNAYDMAKTERDAVIKAAEESKATKQTNQQDTQSAMDDNKATLTTTTEDLTTYKQQLDDVTTSMSTRADEYAERKTTQEGELEAIKQAKKILAKVTGVATEAPANPVLPSPPSLLQVMSVVDPRTRAVELLRSTAKMTHSAALKRLAEHVSLGGHFDEINNMIQKMIFRLHAEQKDEDEHKMWCDQELEKTSTSQNKTAEDKATLQGKIQQLTADIAELEETRTEKQQSIAGLDSFMSEATEVRDIGKEENKRVVKESQDAQTALSQAIAVLEDFYKNSGAIAKAPYESLLQAKGDDITLPEKPALWDSSYTSVEDDPQAGIVAMLSKVSADFSEVEARTKAQEAEDQQKYDKDIQDAKIGKAQAEEEVTQLTTRINRKSEAKQAAEAKKQKKADQLAAETQYLEDLQHACVEGDSTYEDRKANRDREIKGLEEAQTILQDAFKPKKEDP